MFLELIERRKEVNGDEDWQTLRAKRLYASNLWSQGRWWEATVCLYNSSRRVCAARVFWKSHRLRIAKGLSLVLIMAMMTVMSSWIR